MVLPTAVTELGVHLVTLLLVLGLAQAMFLFLIFHYWQHKERSTKVHKNLVTGHFALCHSVIKRTRELKTEIMRQRLCPQPHLSKAAEGEGGCMNYNQKWWKEKHQINLKQAQDLPLWFLILSVPSLGYELPKALMPLPAVPKLRQGPGIDSCPRLPPLPSLPGQEWHNSSATEGSEELSRPSTATASQNTHTHHPSKQVFQQLCGEVAKNGLVNI